MYNSASTQLAWPHFLGPYDVTPIFGPDSHWLQQGRMDGFVLGWCQHGQRRVLSLQAMKVFNIFRLGDARLDSGSPGGVMQGLVTG